MTPAMIQDVAESVMLANLDTQFVCENPRHDEPAKAEYMQFGDCPCTTGLRCTHCVNHNRTRKTTYVHCPQCDAHFPRADLLFIPIGDTK